MRSEALLSIRPSLELDQASKANEAFQNNVLRPILKLQNPITLQLLKSNRYYDPSQSSLGKDKLELHLTALLQNDKPLRNQLIGMVTGMMTESEFSVYQKEKKEYHKRIVTMQLARYLDQLLARGAK